MFTSFEIKSYPQLQFMLGLLNTVFITVGFLCCYHWVLIPEHIKFIDDKLAIIKLEQFLSGLPILVVLSGIWGLLSTVFLRLHDRIHEPHISKWRAWYDSDFILRALCYEFASFFSPDLFERAYVDGRVRNKLMERLFYKFVGDSVSTSEGKRVFFYTVMWKYWTVALLDLYSTVLLLFVLIYSLNFTSVPKFWLLIVLVILIIFCRFLAHRFVDEAHDITIEQIHAIKKANADELKTEAIDVAKELGGFVRK